MKILVDTSIWIDHLRSDLPELRSLLEAGEVVIHEMVIGEIACGSLQDRVGTMISLKQLPKVPELTNTDVIGFLESHGLFSRGIGFVDVHLVASAISHGSKLWTTDARLNSIALDLCCAFSPSGS